MKRDAFTQQPENQLMQQIHAPAGKGRQKKFKRDAMSLSLDLGHELIIDNFAGGGGTSEGLEQAFGRPVDIAINHNEQALKMHAVNHPHTKHLCESVWDVDPIKVTNNQPVALVWLSPDCKHFSKAKGGRPVEKKIRGLAWVALRWAAKCKPRVIALENVEEFKTWGPLMVDENGDFKPDPTKKGHTFRSFVRQLEGHGYTVEFNEMRACDWGTPTIRRRLFMIARRDNRRIVWPAPTHGNPKSEAVKSGQLKPWRTAAECIDWDMECKSIFDRTKPLAEATMRRIAKGIMRYVVNAAEPFIVGQGGPLYSAKPVSTNQPFGTLTTENHRAIVMPTIEPVEQGEGMLTSAALIQTGYGEREGQAPRALDIERPLGTIVGSGKHAIASAFLSPFYSDKSPNDARGTMPDEPVMTIPTENRHALVTAFLAEHANASNQRVMDANEPLRTICAQVKGGHFSAVTATLERAEEDHSERQAAFLAKHYTGVVGSDLNDPIGTVTSTDHHSYVVAHMEALYSQKGNECRGSDIADPIKTVTASARHAVVTTELAAAHIQRDMGQSIGHSADAPLGTVTAGGGGKSTLVTSELRKVDVQAENGLTAAHITKFRTGSTGSAIEEPLPTITAGPEQNPAGAPHALGIVTSNLVKLRGTSSCAATNEPLATISAGGQHHAEVRAFLLKYYGTDQDPQLNEPLHTVTTKERYGLVTIHGQDYQIVDIKLRMLAPRELFRAQGFPESYIIGDDESQGLKLPKSAQVRMCGNSVCPPLAKALIEANFTHEREFANAA